MGVGDGEAAGEEDFFFAGGDAVEADDLAAGDEDVVGLAPDVGVGFAGGVAPEFGGEGEGGGEDAFPRLSI